MVARGHAGVRSLPVDFFNTMIKNTQDWKPEMT